MLSSVLKQQLCSSFGGCLLLRLDVKTENTTLLKIGHSSLKAFEMWLENCIS